MLLCSYISLHGPTCSAKWIGPGLLSSREAYFACSRPKSAGIHHCLLHTAIVYRISSTQHMLRLQRFQVPWTGLLTLHGHQRTCLCQLEYWWPKLGVNMTNAAGSLVFNDHLMLCYSASAVIDQHLALPYCAPQPNNCYFWGSLGEHSSTTRQVCIYYSFQSYQSSNKMGRLASPLLTGFWRPFQLDRSEGRWALLEPDCSIRLMIYRHSHRTSCEW